MIKKTLQYKITEEDQGKTVEQFLRSKGYSHRLVVKLRNSPTGLTIGGKLAYTIHHLQAGEILTAVLEELSLIHIFPGDTCRDFKVASLEALASALTVTWDSPCLSTVTILEEDVYKRQQLMRLVS